ncbi:hypothetical protein D1Z90_19225 [Motilimonas pumila]|uniref:Uncharacterized protein n=1 Tax=Motilimonas pumila TaxID=2303987 RepID=A0A418Y9U3_9GAMM|nr:hypothetical protein D1Z90_19225 [Motilimonas pumila]
MIGVTAIALYQLNDFKAERLEQLKEEALYFSSIQIIRGYLERCYLICFLIFFSNFLPKAGHFIMSWVGPAIGLEVPIIYLNLSLSGIWSVFAIELDPISIIEITLLIISFLTAMYYRQKVRRDKQVIDE